MRILVTGGSGFIGSHLVRMLIEEKGCEVLNLDKLTYAANPEALKDLKGHPNYQFERIDLGQPNVGALLAAPATEQTHTAQASTTAHRPFSEKSLSEIFQHFKPHAVLHLAAESHVDRSIDGPGEFIQTNVVGTYNLLQASLEYWRSLPVGASVPHARNDASDLSTLEPSHLPTQVSGLKSQPSQKSFRFVHVSTDEVYGSLGPSDPPFTEDSPLNPSSPYAASKAAADHLVQSWHTTYGLPAIITRCSNNYGAGQHPEKLIPKVIQCCLKQEPIPVYGTGENIRDWIAVEDHCQALYTVLTKGRVGETYNIGGNNEQTNLDLIKKICVILEEEISGSAGASRAAPSDQSSTIDHQSSHQCYEGLITLVSDRPGHDLRYAIDSSKLRGELSWQPRKVFEASLRATVGASVPHARHPNAYQP